MKPPKWEREGAWLFAYAEDKFHLSVIREPERKKLWAWTAKDLSVELRSPNGASGILNVLEGSHGNLKTTEPSGIRYLSGYGVSQADAKERAANATHLFGS